MTTAYTTYKNGHSILDVSTGKPSTPFDHGAGHVDPISALNPGLAYDLDVNDYLGFLCPLNYTTPQINILAKKNFTCDPTKKYSLTNFNYPSFSVPLLGTVCNADGVCELRIEWYVKEEKPDSVELTEEMEAC
ncbi:hypothetical protein ACSBR2_021730 [Camellia fascicularis]